jgi:hypothetical protein
MTDFGTWKLVGDDLVLKRENWRVVYFDRCNSSSQILDWIFHYSSHGLTAEEMFDLINALKVILHPCKNYCSGGTNKKANGVELVKAYRKSPPKTPFGIRIGGANGGRMI